MIAYTDIIPEKISESTGTQKYYFAIYLIRNIKGGLTRWRTRDHNDLSDLKNEMNEHSSDSFVKIKYYEFEF